MQHSLALRCLRGTQTINLPCQHQKSDSDGLQHKGTVSTKPVFEKKCKDTKVICPVMWIKTQELVNVSDFLIVQQAIR